MLTAMTVVLLVFYLFLLVQWQHVKRYIWFCRGFVGLILVFALGCVRGQIRYYLLTDLLMPIFVIWALVSAFLACYQGPAIADRTAEDLKTMLEQSKPKDTDQ